MCINNGGCSNSKRFVMHDYHDHAFDRLAKEEMMAKEQYACDFPTSTIKRKGPRGGVAIPFPEKLHNMLSQSEKDGHSHIISWQPHGRCFLVRKPKEFVKDIMPTFFRQSKLTSFQRQLNLYGFCRLTSGPDRGAYYHELFLRGQPDLCRNMVRTRIKGTGIKASSSPTSEPNFYSMPPVPLNGRPTKHDQEEKKELGNVSLANIVEEDSETEGTPSEVASNEIPLLLPSVEDSAANTGPLELPSELLRSASPFKREAVPVTPDIKRNVLSTPPGFLEELVLNRSFTPPPTPPFEPNTEGDMIFFEGRSFHYLDSSSFEFNRSSPKPCTPARMVSMDSSTSSSSLDKKDEQARSKTHHQQDESDVLSLGNCWEPVGLRLSVDNENAQLSLEEFPIMDMLLY